MFIELTIAPDGVPVFGWCADTAPVDPSQPLYSGGPDGPPGSRRVRLELTTTEGMEIDDRAKKHAAARARELMDTGQVERAGEALAKWKQYRLMIIRRDVRVEDFAGVPAPAFATAPGVPYVRPVIGMAP